MLDAVSGEEAGGRFFRRVRPWPKPPPDDVQDAVPPGDEVPRHGFAFPPPSLSTTDMDSVRELIRHASAEQLTIMIALVFTQIRESGFTLSSPMESVVNGRPPAWRVLDGQRRQVGAVTFQEGEWTTK